MLFDGVSLVEGSSLSNATISSGAAFPSNADVGELFYLTVNPIGLHIHDGTDWNIVGAGTVSFDELSVKQAVRAATTDNITLSGAQTIDDVSVIAGDRVLVKNQTTGSQNGIYVASAGAWSRSSDFDGSPETEVKAGDFCFVTEGTTNGDTGWILTNNGTVVIGTTALVFAQFTGGATGDLAGGATGDIPFQSAPGDTTFSSSFKFEPSPVTLRLGTVSDPGLMAPVPFGVGDGVGAALQIQGGTSGVTSGSGGALTIIGGSAQANGAIGGDLILSSGLCTHPLGGAGGAVVLRTGSFNATSTERIRLLNTGALSFGASGTAYGTSGQVLTSNGNATPSWQSIPVLPAQVAGGTAGQIPFQSAANTTTFSGALRFETAGPVLRLGTVASPLFVAPNVFGAGSGAGATLTFQGGTAGTTGGAGGVMTVQGGTAQAAGAVGGNLVLSSGLSSNPSSGTGGAILFLTGAVNNVRNERMRLLNTGALSFGASGTAYGTDGQVLTSNGDATPAWEDVKPTRIPRATTFTQSLTDRGNRIVISTGITLPASVYSAGDAISFYNSTASPVTITQGSGLTLRQDGTTNTGNRSLKAYGTCSVWYDSASVAVISGSLE